MDQSIVTFLGGITGILIEVYIIYSRAIQIIYKKATVSLI